MSERRRSPVTIDHPEPHTCTVDVRRHVLANVPFFAELTADDIAWLDERARVEDFAAGNAVHHIGQPARRLFVVATGTAKSVRTAPDGTEVLLEVLRPGDFFGALPVLGSETYTDSAWAITPLCVLSIDVDTFEEVLHEHPSVARAGLQVVAERLHRSQERLHAMATATSEQRVAGVLLMLAEHAGSRRRDRTIIDLPLSRDDLAGLTGVASETVSRVLAQLRRDGVIDSGRRWVAITDTPALTALASAR